MEDGTGDKPQVLCTAFCLICGDATDRSGFLTKEKRKRDPLAHLVMLRRGWSLLRGVQDGTRAHSLRLYRVRGCAVAL